MIKFRQSEFLNSHDAAAPAAVTFGAEFGVSQEGSSRLDCRGVGGKRRVEHGDDAIQLECRRKAGPRQRVGGGGGGGQRREGAGDGDEHGLLHARQETLGLPDLAQDPRALRTVVLTLSRCPAILYATSDGF